MVTKTEADNFNPRIGFLVNADDEVAIATLNRDTVTKNYNEETGTYDPQGSTTIKVDAMTKEPKLEFDAARAVDNSALEELGIYVETDDGLKYKRGAERKFDALELWWFDADEDDLGDLETEEPDTRERFEDATVDIDSEETDETTLTFSCVVHVEGSIYAHYDPTTT